MVLTFREAAEYGVLLNSMGFTILSMRQFPDPDIHTHLPDAWHIWAQHYEAGKQMVDTRNDYFTKRTPHPKAKGRPTVICGNIRSGLPIPCPDQYPEETIAQHRIACAAGKRPQERG